MAIKFSESPSFKAFSGLVFSHRKSLANTQEAPTVWVITLWGLWQTASPLLKVYSQIEVQHAAHV